MNIDTTYTWTPVVAVALVGALAAGVLYLRPPLESARPVDPYHTIQAPQHHGAIVSRLWQDPHHAIREHFHRTSLHPSDSADNVPTVADFAHAVATKPPGKQLRIVAMMPGTPYAYDRETRRRQRHALVSALTHKRYVPVNENQFGYFTVPSLHGTHEQHDHSNYILVGYEYYVPGLDLLQPMPWASILVLWVNADDYDSYPLHHISAVLAAMDAPIATYHDPVTVVLGPVDSGGLRRMLFEPKEMPPKISRLLHTLHHLLTAPTNGAPVRIPQHILPRPPTNTGSRKKRHIDPTFLRILATDRRAGLVLLSPRATLPLDILACASHDHRCRKSYRISSDDAAAILRAEQRLTDQLRIKQFRSVVARDDLVLQSVLHELVKRGACTHGEGKPTVVVVSEQDTVYGRLLDEIAAASPGFGFVETCDLAIQDYGYLRGVDGEIAPQRPFEDPVASDRRVPQMQPTPRTPAAFRLPLLFGAPAEPAQGVHQLDYMRRLAERIARSQQTGDSVVAVGVMGADVYDKILIIQALRDQLAGITFFTTDLDARLLSPDANRWTRNLLVGSAHGLALKACDPAEFRDSYQTAFFHAVSLALTAHSPAHLPPAPVPRLFEVGRVHAVDITPTDNNVRSACYPTEDAPSNPGPYGSIFGLMLPALGLALFGFLPVVAP